MKVLVVLVLALLASITEATVNITVSGVSSGGAMAVQFHVAYASMVNGAGVVAGMPYWCANDNVIIAQANCMRYPDLISVTELVTATKYAFSTGTIDSPSILSTSKVYLYSGTLDTTVNPGVVKKLQQYYETFIPSRNIKTVFNIPSAHAMVTNNYGNECSYFGSPFLNNCQYDTAGEILNYLYGNLSAPVAAIDDNFVQMGQISFIPGGLDPTHVGLSDNAYIYVPSNCKSGSGCDLHVAFHGCLQTLADINTTFVYQAGYNGWAEANNIVILYPQAATNTLNPNGCWDWWGYTGPAYASKLGIQMITVKAMVEHVAATYIL